MNKGKEKDINHSESVDQDLMRIYSDANGKLNDVSRLDIKKRNPLVYIVYLLFILSIFLGVISWLGFFVFAGNGKYTGKSMDIKISTQQEIASGDEIKYVIEYTNKDNVALLNTEVTLRYPVGFTFIKSEPLPSNQYNNLWDFGTLVKGQRAKIEVIGKMIGELGSIKTVETVATFQPENFSSSFKEIASISSQITSSLLSLNIEGPDQTIFDKDVIYKISYQNTSDKDINNIQIIAHYPENFVFKSSKPQIGQVKSDKDSPDGDKESSDEPTVNNKWFYDILESQEKGELTIEGKYIFRELNGSQEAEAELVVQIGYLEDEEFSLQLENNIATKIFNQNLKLDLVVNGEATDSSVNIGETLNYFIVYKNLGQQKLEDIRIKAVLQSDILDWETLSDKNLGKVEKGEITWDKESISNLGILNPLDEGTIEFSIKIKDINSVNLENINLEITQFAQALVKEINDIPADVSVTTHTITHNINTALEMNIEGRYFDDDNLAVGSGPLPPMVGEKTTFRIFWYLSNNIHEVTDVTLITHIPEGVAWVDKYLITTGQLNYNANDHSVTWKISGIPPNKTFEDINAWFDISVVPKKEQVGKLIVLTTETNLEAIDKKTNVKILQLKRSITSNLEDDPIGGGRGLVVDSEE